MAAIYPHALGSEAVEGTVCLIRDELKLVVYRRTRSVSSPMTRRGDAMGRSLPPGLLADAYSGSNMDSEYSSVLLRWHPAFQRVSTDMIVQDYSAGLFMVERLVAAGASYAVTDNDIFTTKDALDRIPESFASA